MNDYLLFFLAWALGGLINNITGFGAALVAMPFLASSIPLETAVPSSTLIVLTLNAHLGWKYRNNIKWGQLRFLFLGGLVGALVGATLHQAAGNSMLKLGMGIFLVVYSTYCLLPRQTRAADLKSWWAIVAGFASTILGALFGFNGPPLAMYVARKGWKPEEAKSVLAACFIMTGVMISLGQLLAGVHNMETLAGYLAGCPGALLGGMVGLMLSKNISQRVYQKGILLLVLLSGVHIIATSL